MPLQNIHHIEADIKRKKYAEEPRVTSNDDIAFIVSITDDESAIDMDSVTSATLASTRLDKQTVITAGTKLADGTIKFELGHTETKVPGQVKAVAQLFDAEGDRISSVAWTYIVDRDPTGEGYVPTEKDKTFIEVVLVEGPATIQEAKDVTIAAQQAVVNADAATGRANTAAEGAELVVDEFAGFKDSAAKGKVFPSVDDRFEELELDSYFPVKNEVQNGNFSRGLEGWTSANSTSTVDMNTLSNTSNGTFLVAGIKQVIEQEFISAHKLYVKAKTKVSNDLCINLKINVRGTVNAGTLQELSFKNPVMNTLYYLTGVVTLPANGSGNIDLRVEHQYPDNATANGKSMHVENVLVIDLTKIFGIDIEPTTDEMDKLLAQYPTSWFDGTVNLAENRKFLKFLLNQARGKANKQQEAWIKPTLLNGWKEADLAPVSYMKDDFGFVHFKGIIQGGSTGAAFVLPLGYRPNTERHFVLAHGVSTSNAKVVILTNGQPYFGGYTNWIALDVVSFKVET